MLSKQAIEEFRKIYRKTYGKELPFEEAAEQAQQFLRLFKFIVGYPLEHQQRGQNDEQSAHH